MCKALPYGRCAADSRPKYQEAKEALDEILQTSDGIHFKTAEDIRAFRTAQYRVMANRLVYTATPEGLKKSRQKIEEHNGSDAEIQDEIKYYEDALALNHANNKNVARFFQDSTYYDTNDLGGKTVVAMPLSITNIAQVNDWIIASQQELPPITPETTETDEDGVVVAKNSLAEDETPEVKTSVKVFNKKGQLHFQQDGNSYSLSEKAYLVRKVGEKEFTLVKADKFENKYQSLIEDGRQPVLNNIVLGRIFPSTRLSDFIELAQTGKKKD